MDGTSIGSVARRSRAVTQRDIALFTEITGDRNPIHYDEDLAASSRFGGLVVQGGVTSGLLNALVAEQLPRPGSAFLEVVWHFLAPVRPGDVITAQATVTSVRTDKPVTTLATQVTNQAASRFSTAPPSCGETLSWPLPPGTRHSSYVGPMGLLTGPDSPMTGGW